jgi:TnpA family transposase
MPSVNDTAYRRLKSNPSAKELNEAYTPSIFELVYAEERTRGAVPRLGFLLLLKTFQRLGYFVAVKEIPPLIVKHVAECAGHSDIPSGLFEYDESSARWRHIDLIREFLGVHAWGENGERLMAEACGQAAKSKDDLADIINVAIEELVRQRFELPGFSTLLRAAQHARAEVNKTYHKQVAERLGAEAKYQLQKLLTPPAYETQSQWDRVKIEPKQPTSQTTGDFLDHLQWLRGLAIPSNIFADIPDVKIKQFSAEARSLDLASMNDLVEPKRFALATALVVTQIARALDDVGDMYKRMVEKLHNHAYDALIQHQSDQVERTDSLVGTLRDVTKAYKTEGGAEERLAAIGAVLEPDADEILAQCEAHNATAGHNYLPFLTRFYSHQRSVLFQFLETVELVSTSPDKSLTEAIAFILKNKADRHEWLPVLREETKEDGTKERVTVVDLSFVSDKWWPLVAGQNNTRATVDRVDRRFFELCVITEVMRDLKSCDLCIPGSDQYSDYRAQLLTEEECQEALATYSDRAGLPTEGKALLDKLLGQLKECARKADEGYPNNAYLRIENDKIVLKRFRRPPDPPGLRQFERLLKDRMKPVGILDALVDTDEWLNWTRHFRPISGHDTKLDNPRDRYLINTFCYGFDFGPTQTSRSIRGVDRRQVAFINQRHVTEEYLDEAITTVVNSFHELPLPKIWGLGNSASADGTKWDLYVQNLISEYHIRYGGYGGIGYYLVSDSYIALFSRFTTCGSWEGHYILDFIQQTDCAIKPDTIHADTQGQSAAIFALAYLLGIKLQPRIRNWKGLIFYRPSPDCHFEHIDPLFTEQPDWKLIETMLPEMLRVVLSIGAGRIKPSTILRRLATHSRKNKLYFAFRELGSVVRTAFLLEYLSDAELRRTIQVATNKSERFNQFVQWVAFGGGALASEGVRDEQRKFIKYNHLVANLLIYHNAVTMTRAIQELMEEGYVIDPALVACFTPYQTEHFIKFGRYTLNRGRVPEPLDKVRVLRMPPRSEQGQEGERAKTKVSVTT